MLSVQSFVVRFDGLIPSLRDHMADGLAPVMGLRFNFVSLTVAISCFAVLLSPFTSTVRTQRNKR